MLNLNEDHEVVQYGKVLPNGAIEWQTADVWDPAWSTPEGREAERVAHRNAIAQLGVELNPDIEIKFVTRTKTVTYSEITEIDDAPIVDDSSDPQTGSESA